MRAVDLIRKKRDSGEHTREEIEFLVSGYTHHEIPDYQFSAWLMAAVIRGLNPVETSALTNAMLKSGSTLDLSALAGKKVDKHSTGGVGDNTSLILAPIVAAGGLYVPMISGRGLGHTGGTLDKLEAIPGFNTQLSLDEFREVLRKCGMALIGQTSEIAPADKKIYALRDATATVENIGLVCASIMSKKLAEGIDALVLDVKTGSGAFLKNHDDAIALAELMVDTARRSGTKAVALLSDMNQPLGRMAGHSNEVIECIDVLRGEGPDDLRELSIELSAWMFYLGERCASVEDARTLSAQLIQSGAALEKFRTGIELQGGDPRIIDDNSLLPFARNEVDIRSPRSGFVRHTNCHELGIALALIGGGRTTKESHIDHGVGLEFHKRIGDRVSEGEALVTIHYNSDSGLERAKALIMDSYEISESKAQPPPLIHGVVGGSGDSGRHFG